MQPDSLMGLTISLAISNFLNKSICSKMDIYIISSAGNNMNKATRKVLQV